MKKFYKVFAFDKKGRRFSLIASGKARKYYRPNQKSKGKVFRVKGSSKKIQNPIYAFDYLRNIYDFLKFTPAPLPDKVEIWEVLGEEWRGKPMGIAASSSLLESGFVDRIVSSSDMHFIDGTVLLSFCIPVRRIKVIELELVYLLQPQDLTISIGQFARKIKTIKESEGKIK